MRIDLELEAERLTEYAYGLEVYDPEQALQLYREAIILNPTNSRAHFRYGKIELNRGNIAIAVNYLRKNFAMVPDHAPSLEILLRATVKYHQFKRARRLLDQNVSILHIEYQHAGLYVATIALTRNLGVPKIPLIILQSCSKNLLNCCCTLSKEIRIQVIENEIPFRTKGKPLTIKEAKKLLLQLV